MWKNDTLATDANGRGCSLGASSPAGIVTARNVTVPAFPRHLSAGDERLLWGRIEPTGRSQAKVRQGPTWRFVDEGAARLGQCYRTLLSSSAWTPARGC